MVWKTVGFVIWVLWAPSTFYSTTHGTKLIECTQERFYGIQNSGKTSFVYFGNKVNPTIRLFLEKFEKSAEALEDYGILVAKVNCSRVEVPKYCTGGDISKKVYLFRGGEILKIFAIDTVFDVDAIVAHVLFTVIFNEVKYVQTPAELLHIEKAAKGRADVVLAHVVALGIPEHRAVMETAFVYGAKYQFVLTTGGTVLEHLGVKDPASLPAGLWFLHCKAVAHRSEGCDRTALRRPLTTINIYTFLQLMEAPLVTEASVEPSQVRTVHSRLHTPLLFVFTQRETLDLDRNTALSLARRLRGQAGLVLLHRDNPAVNIPVEYNVAYRVPGEGSPVEYLTLKNLDEAVRIFQEQNPLEEEEEGEDEEEQHWSVLDILDDEVAESVYRDRDLELNFDLVPELTAETISTAVAGNGHTVVIFYTSWDAVSMAFMRSYLEVANMLKDVTGVQLARVDCGEWTDVCSNQNVSHFPTVKLFHPSELPQLYRGMLGTESLYRFIMLGREAVPLLLSNEDEVQSYLGGELYQRYAAFSPVTVLGLFSSSQDQGSALFGEAAKMLRGEVFMGVFTEEEAAKWAQNYAVKLPAMLVCRGPDSRIEAFTLQISGTEEMVSTIQRAVLDKFPELTVENLPAYLELGKPLLMLFVEEEDGKSEGIRRELQSLLGKGQLDSYLPCWIHLGRTPAGKAILESYLGSVPLLPVLLLSELGSGGEVFEFPPGKPMLADSILHWLSRVKRKEEQPAGVIADEKWAPPVPFYDFLAIMDKEVPGFATQRTPKSKDMFQEVEEKDLEGEVGPSPPQSGSTAPHPHTEL
ncbi:thioredoxin domain-containing protein 16 isoform X1 [Lepisosteus oculatus]|uniref:thioredoxin domain-containing protein 16 isoform X1 n=2 Tax=Lepisosteus oculatus TaxID=7918 RepID=UPI003721B4B1